MKRRIVLGLLLGVLVSTQSAWGQASKPETAPRQPSSKPAETPFDALVNPKGYWLSVFVAGQKMGYMHYAVSRIKRRGEDLFRTRLESVTKMKSLGTEMAFEVVQWEEYDAAPPYALRRACLIQDDGDYEQTILLEQLDSKYFVKASTLTGGFEKEIEAFDHPLSESLALELWLLSDEQEIGTTLTSYSLDLEKLKRSADTFTLKKKKRAVFNGVSIPVFEIEVAYEVDGMSGSVTFTKMGQIHSGTLGGTITLRRDSKKVAQSIDGDEDIYLLTSVDVDKPLGDPDTLAELILEGEASLLPSLESSAGQSIIRNGKTVQLRLGPKHGKPIVATEKEVKENLKATVRVPCDIPKVVSLAQKAIGDATTVRAKVNRLVHFVSEYVIDELDGNPPSVLDIIDSKTGDCSEHSLLFVALARAVGIPCREVGGLIYMGDDYKSLGWHAWNEVVIDGQWIPVDSTWDETEINPTHISFGHKLGVEPQVFGKKLELKVIRKVRKLAQP